MSDSMFDDEAFRSNRAEMLHGSAGLTDESPGLADPPQSEEPGAEDKPARRSVAAQIVDLARASYTLGVTDTDDPFGVSRDRPHVAMMLRGGKAGLRAELSRQFFAITNTVPSQQALADACMVLEGFAAQEHPQRVYLRVGELGGAVYIDMGDTSGRVIEISRGRWKVVETAPVLFRRTKLTGELPHPHPGDLAALWEFVSVDTEDRPVLLAVLVAALIQVDVPHPVLALLAEQGSAKSTITRILVSLLDPSAVPLRQPPRDPDGWTTAAAASWVVALDNLSGTVPDWLSDCLCRASTGDGSVKRALYTDSDVAVMAFRRVPIINGVDLIVDRGDLAERVVAIGLPRVKMRRAEDELAAAWAEAHPWVLGGLLDLAADVHHRLPAIEVDDLPRMADFAKVLAGVDEVLGTTGLARYRERSQLAAADTLDAPLIAELVATGTTFDDATSAEILRRLTPQTESGWRRPRGWPKNARAVTGLLTRHAPALRALGWTVDNDQGRNAQHATRWTLTPPEPEKAGVATSRTSPESSLEVEAQLSDEVEASYEVTPSQDDSAASPEKVPLTSVNEVASQTSQANPPSPLLCPECGRAPARSGTDLCDLCTNHARQQAVARQLATLTSNGNSE